MCVNLRLLFGRVVIIQPTFKTYVYGRLSYCDVLRIDTHLADIHGFMNVALVGAIVKKNCADESYVHKTMNVSKVSVNPYIYINSLLHNHLLLSKTRYFHRKIGSKDSDRHNFRILFNSHFVLKTHPFVGSSNNMTFIVTSSKMTSFFRENVTLCMETSPERTTLHQSTDVSIKSAALLKVK